MKGKPTKGHFVNVETGEVFEKGKIEWVGNAEYFDADQARTSVNVSGLRFNEDSIGIYKPPEHQPFVAPTHDEFGEMRMFSDRRKFSRVFQTNEPIFSKDAYYKYWVRIERSIEMNTGVICHRKSNGSVERVTTMKRWENFLEIGRSETYRFIKECTDKNYLTVWPLKPNKYWIVNPSYTWNGYMIPKAIWRLFQLNESEC